MATLSYTDQGRRKYQQDAVFVSPSKKFAANRKTRVLGIVCDGMGGMADGGKASRTAIEMMKTGFGKVQNMKKLDIPAFFRQAIVTMDREIASFPKENGRGSGTTMLRCSCLSLLLFRIQLPSTAGFRKAVLQSFCVS